MANVSDNSGNVEDTVGTDTGASAPPEPGNVPAEPKGAGPSGAGPSGAGPSGAGPSGFRKFVDWFWLGSRVRALRSEGLLLSPRGVELLRRSRVASELGGRALEPAEPFASGLADGLACELYRESIFWSLSAQRERVRATAAGAEASQPAESESPAPSLALAELWQTSDQELLTRVAGGKGTKEELDRHMGKSFADFAELDTGEQARLARTLRAFAEGLVGSLDIVQRRIERIWFLRLLRLAGLGVLAFFVVLGYRAFADWKEQRGDLSIGSKWEASSKYAEGGCEATEQHCASSPNYFVHTNEEKNPWLIIDLQAPKTISGITVKNRIDCCYERTQPLVVEVSLDKNQWKEVARKTSEFTTWHASFSSVQGRYVKLYIPKRTNLHLAEVRILP